MDTQTLLIIVIIFLLLGGGAGTVGTLVLGSARDENRKGSTIMAMTKHPASSIIMPLLHTTLLLLITT